MEKIESAVAWTAFGVTAIIVLLSPWCFGAWEAWWFWPFTGLVFIATSIFGTQLLLRATHHERHTVSGRSQVRANGDRRRRRMVQTASRKPLRIICLATSLLFLCYATMRFLRAPVFVDAQRSLLLFVAPFLLGLQIVYGFNSQRRFLLHRMILFNLLLLGLYGILNHSITGSSLVLWRPGFSQYFGADRASGSYFCPDHYAGIMEIALCMALGIVCARDSTWRWRLAGVLVSIVSVTGVIMSKSRGGGMTVVVILAAACVWGVAQYPPRRRWAMRSIAVAVLVAGLLGITLTGNAYITRFATWFGWEQSQDRPLSEMTRVVWKRVQRSSRWNMSSGALRAWRESKLKGIGPGMHQTIWPHVAASPDGDVESGQWPSRLNNQRYSYEVHNDWIQLLEEYGIIGFALLLAAVVAMGGSLLSSIRSAVGQRACGAPSRTTGSQFALVTGALLSLLALAFHSLGDFNLQLPATGWLFGVILATGLEAATRRDTRGPQAYCEVNA